MNELEPPWFDRHSVLPYNGAKVEAINDLGMRILGTFKESRLYGPIFIRDDGVEVEWGDIWNWKYIADLK